MSGCVKIFEDKRGDNNYDNNKFISLHIDDDQLLENYKTVWEKIGDLQNIKFDFLPIYEDRYIKTKKRTCGDKVCTNFRDLNKPEDGVEYRSFPVISIDALLVYDNKYYLLAYLDNCSYRIVDKLPNDWFLLEIDISGVAVQSSHQNSKKLWLLWGII